MRCRTVRLLRDYRDDCAAEFAAFKATAAKTGASVGAVTLTSMPGCVLA